MINVSIVLYQNDVHKIKKAINSCLQSDLISEIFLIDNSPDDKFRVLNKISSKITYIFTGKNLGYGKGHNIALKETINKNVPYHIVLNPDVYFYEKTIEDIYNFINSDTKIGLLMPKVLYPDGSIQYLCKLLPSPLDLFGRRFLNYSLLKKYIEKRNEIYELRFTGYNQIMEVPSLSGCFMFMRTSILKKVGIFDERFFMYLEDVDLSRRIYKISKTIYYPFASIYHEYGKGSYKNKKLLRYHVESAIKYFNKWGWFFDIDRKKINKETLERLGYI